MATRTALALLALLAHLAPAAEPAPKLTPTGYTYSHRNWLDPAWADTTGKMLTDGAAGPEARPVIFKGNMAMDFVLPGPCQIERVVVHAFRGNEWYLLDAVELYARQLGSYSRIAADTTGYRGPAPSAEYLYEFGGLTAVTDSIRLQMLTPNHTGLTEVEFFGRPTAARPPGTDALPVALSDTEDLIATDGVTDATGRRKVRLENRFVQLIIDPQRGGIIESVVLKPSGRQLTYNLPGERLFPGGLLEDHNWDPYYSYAQFPFTPELRRDGDQAVLVLRGRGGEGQYAFTEIVKTLALRRDRASLDVDYELRNDPSSMTEYTYAWWCHNCLAVAGETNTCFIPSARGIQRFEWKPGRSRFDTWVYDVTRGWTGVLGASGSGVAIETDYRTLNCFYVCHLPQTTTLEWRLTRLTVAPGQALKTSTRFCFVNGLQELTGVNAGLAGSLAPLTRAIPDTTTGFVATLFSDRARTAAVEAVAERIAGGQRTVLGTAAAEFAAGEVKSWTWSAALPAGTYRLLLTTTSAQDRMCGERELVVGPPDGRYSQAPEGERVGVAGTGGTGAGELRRHDLSLAYETPHEKWAKPLPGGPLHALVLIDVNEQREIVELAQRLDLEVETVKIRSNLQNADYAYRGDRSVASLADAQARLQELLLERRFDLFVLGGLNWETHFTDAVRNTISSQVRDGAGLVWIGCSGEAVVDESQTPLLPVVSPTTRQWTTLALPDASVAGAVPVAENLARLIPLAEQLPLLSYPYPCEKVTGSVHLVASIIGGKGGRGTVLVTGGYGKGRTVSLAYDNAYTGGRDYPSRLLPAFCLHNTIRPKDPTYRYWEDMYALLARVLVWAAQREAPARLVSAEVQAGEPQRLVVAALAVGDACLHLSWQDEFGVEVATAALAPETATASGDRTAWSVPVPPALPAGPAYVHLYLRDAGGAALDWGAAAFTVVGPVRLVRVEQPREFLPAGEPLDAVAVVTSPAPPPDLRLEVTVTDGFGRRLAQESVPVSFAGQQEAHTPLRYPSSGALGGQVRLRLRLRDASRVYVARTVTFGLTRFDALRGPRLVVWDSTLGSNQRYLNVLETQRFLDLGMDAVLDHPFRSSHPHAKVLIENGVHFHGLNCLSIRDGAYASKVAAFLETGDKANLVRKPCFDDPQDRAAMAEAFRKACAPLVAKGGALDYCLGDEMSLTHYTDYFDFDFHPSALARFREWLQTQYSSLDSLNAEWQTDYKAWEAVQPLTFEEAKAREERGRKRTPNAELRSSDADGVPDSSSLDVRRSDAPAQKGQVAAGDATSPAAWCDFRTYMEVSFADFLALIQKEAEALDPRSRISLSGTQSPTAGNGMDWWRLSRAIPMFHSYDTSNMCQARRSFSPWLGDEPWHAGYWAEDPAQRRNLWWCLFHNCSGVSAWYAPILFYPDLTFTEGGAQLRDAWRELRNGIWQQVRALQLERPKVAVHYSQASIHFTHLRGDRSAVPDAWEGWLRSLEDLAIPYDFVAYEQLERGNLDHAGYQVLVLPCSVSLSDGEAAAIERFARTGGLVLADALPGIVNQHGNPAQREELVRLFGLSAAADAPDALDELRFGDRGTLPQMRPIQRLTLADGTAAGRAETADTPVLVRTPAGQGETVLLNFPTAFYQTARRAGKEPERVWRQLLTEILTRHRIAPSATIRLENSALPHVEVVRYFEAKGSPVLYGFLPAILPGDKEQRAEVVLTGAPRGRLFDLRTGKDLGRAPRFTTVLRPGEPRLLAVVPKRVRPDRPPVVRARLGETVTVDIAFSGLALPQAIRCEVTDPTGRARPEYGTVLVAAGGRGQLRLPLAANDPTGTWNVHLTHVLTGTRLTRTVVVE